MGDLTENFSAWEFACPCCGEARIQPHHVEMLQQVRDTIDFPMHINSGYRCALYNATLADAVPNSAHTRGEASDVSCRDAAYRIALVQAALEVGFNRIGIAKTYIHLDKDPFLPAPRMWVY